MKKPSGKTAVRGRLLFLCACLAAVYGAGAFASGAAVLDKALSNQDRACLTWDLPCPDSGMYTVSVCQEGTQTCRFSGTTVARTYLLDSLKPDTCYSIHVGYANGGTAETKVTLPGEKPANDGEGIPGTVPQPGAQTAAVTGNPSVQRLNASTVAVSWAEDGEAACLCSLSLRKAGDTADVPVGTTVERIFAIDGLAAGTSYTVFIKASGRKSITYDFKMPAAGDS